MGLFNPGSGRGSNPRARAQRLDMALGILGFFTFMAAVQTVILEVQGKPAALSALILLALVVVLWAIWRARRRLPG